MARLLEAGKRLSRALTEATARGDALQARLDQPEAAHNLRDWQTGQTSSGSRKATEANVDESQGKIQELSRELEAGGNALQARLDLFEANLDQSQGYLAHKKPPPSTSIQELSREVDASPPPL